MTIFDTTATALKAEFEAAATDSIDVHRQGTGTDDFGNPNAAYAFDHSEPAWSKLRLFPDEDRDDQESVLRRKVVYVKASGDVLDTDRVVYDGRTYHVSGVETVYAGTVAYRKRVILEVAS